MVLKKGLITLIFSNNSGNLTILLIILQIYKLFIDHYCKFVRLFYIYYKNIILGDVISPELILVCMRRICDL